MKDSIADLTPKGLIKCIKDEVFVHFKGKIYARPAARNEPPSKCSI